MQKKLIQSGPLHDEQGRLIQAGYATVPLKRYIRSRIAAPAWRIKEWDYYLICSDALALALTIADNGYMGLDSISLMDFSTHWQHTASRTCAFPLGRKSLSDSSAEGNAYSGGRKYEITFKKDGPQRHLYGHMYDFGGPDKPLLFDITLLDEPAESMVLVKPFARRPSHFYYNQKINCMAARGRCLYNGHEYLLAPATSFAVLDWGRGVWPYRCQWYWASASGIVNGRRFGLNLGYGFGDDSAASENMVFYDGRAYKLGQVQMTIPRRNGHPDWLSPWQLQDDQQRLALAFTPTLLRQADLNAVLLASHQRQVFGQFSGTISLDGVTRLAIQQLTGFAEKVWNRW